MAPGQVRTTGLVVKQPVPHRESGGLQPGVSPELREQPLDVRPDGRRRDAQAADHSGGVLASHQELQALLLASGEALGQPHRIALPS